MRKRALFALALLTLTLVGAVARAQPQRQRLSPQLTSQIQALRAKKLARAPAERKIASRLLHARSMRRGRSVAAGVPTLRTGVEVAADGTTSVDVRAEVTPTVLTRIRALGGKVIHASPQYRAIRARLPLERVAELAELADVHAIRPADHPITNKLDTSEGDVAHRADQLRSAFGADGTGITVGVLSDGVSSLAARQATGDLPASVTILPGQAGSGNEGTAMLEIVYDLAPGADLVFATAFGGQASFATNILELEAAGADVIVDDVFYFAESVFQDDNVADAVTSVSSAGVLYFSSAGNSGNFNDGESGVWEGDFVASTATVDGRPAADFGGGVFGNEVIVDTPFHFTLHWADPNAASGNDYDLYLTDNALTTVLAASDDSQDGNDFPFELIDSTLFDDTSLMLLVVRFSGADRFFHLNANRGRLAIGTDGQTSGHSAARDAFSVAAVDVRPVSGAFTGNEPVESFSSDGPRRVFYEADGTPITPGDFSSTGGELRQKPDLAAADCVSTSTPGFTTFCGTSAAAPHVAAIAALLLEIGGGAATPAAIRDALLSTALDIEAAGVDNDSGSGIVDAQAAGGVVLGCVDDSDCDQDLFCGGPESCVAGTCMAGPGGDPCAGGPLPFCDEEGDVCVACIGDGDCADGAFCTGVETCVAGACVAGPGDPCSGGALPICDEARDVCVSCLGDGDCADGAFCTGVETCAAGACVAGPGDPCTGGALPFCDEAGDVCVACVDDGDCDDGAFCTGVDSCVAGTCEPGSGEPCAGGPLPFCDEIADVCIECVSDAACDDGLFCTGVETCVAGACVAEPDDVCAGGPLPVCDESGDVCAQCLVSADCSGRWLCEARMCVVPTPTLSGWLRWLVVPAMLLAASLAARARPTRPVKAPPA